MRRMLWPMDTAIQYDPAPAAHAIGSDKKSATSFSRKMALFEPVNCLIAYLI